MKYIPLRLPSLVSWKLTSGSEVGEGRGERETGGNDSVSMLSGILFFLGNKAKSEAASWPTICWREDTMNLVGF